jgi:hypothetical protein
MSVVLVRCTTFGLLLYSSTFVAIFPGLLTRYTSCRVRVTLWMRRSDISGTLARGWSVVHAVFTSVAVRALRI